MFKVTLSKKRFSRLAFFIVVLSQSSFVAAFDSSVQLTPGTPTPLFNISCPPGQVISSITNNVPNCQTPPPGPPGPQGASGPQGPQGPLGPNGHYTQIASMAANTYSGSNNTGYDGNILAYSYCLNGASSIFGSVNGMTVAEQENPNVSGANINSISFLVPNNHGFSVNAYCATGGYINVYAYTYN